MPKSMRLSLSISPGFVRKRSSLVISSFDDSTWANTLLIERCWYLLRIDESDGSDGDDKVVDAFCSCFSCNNPNCACSRLMLLYWFVTGVVGGDEILAFCVRSATGVVVIGWGGSKSFLSPALSAFLVRLSLLSSFVGTSLFSTAEELFSFCLFALTNFVCFGFTVVVVVAIRLFSASVDNFW